MNRLLFSGAALWVALVAALEVRADDDLFRTQIAPILARRCLGCHNEVERKGDLSLATGDDLAQLGYVSPGDADGSYLVELVTPTAGQAEMPKDSDPLKAEEIERIRGWIDQGGIWPERFTIEPIAVTDTDWWSLRPLVLPAVPDVPIRIRDGRGGMVELPAAEGNPIDAFVARKQQAAQLSMAPEASRETLIRRLYFDLIGLPPTSDEITRFVNDPSPSAYESLVDMLLASPRYGERWARHWLDVVHYADTHGYDKDKPRPNAWPYRDYVIRALNEDKPWSRFVQEQVAGDVLFPDTRDGVEALGFLAAGPWDFVGHAEVPESKIDGKIARHLDRDDMVRTAVQSVISLTVGCAQCHNHKFDPISQEDYYSLHAVFAAVDRADKSYFADPHVAVQHRQITVRQAQLVHEQQTVESRIRERAGAELTDVEAELRQRRQQEGVPNPNSKARYGYHSHIVADQDDVKWVQVDLGSRLTIKRIVLRPAFDEFNNIGAGFGFPLRFRVEAADDPAFQDATTIVTLQEEHDFANPGVQPVAFDADQFTARYVRVTATRLAERQNDYILALAELQVLSPDDENLARGKTVTALDSIEAPPRWQRENLVDDNMPVAVLPAELEELQARRDRIWIAHSSAEERDQLATMARQLGGVEHELKALPEPNQVYAATVHQGAGAFAGTGASGGRPRTIHLLRRGDVTKPDREVGPGTLTVFPDLPGRFELTADDGEGQRRAALAQWLTSPGNHLTWRSVVNRVWQYHFGRGLVETPNDFGRMGARPTHPELLDWLAVQFRDGDQSLKSLHKLIVTSRTYRQSSTVDDVDHSLIANALAVDADNALLWRMNRRRLEAEAVRDAILQCSGKLDLQMGGPAYQDFVVEKPEHSPHYQYHLHDPDDPASHRRSVYRFIVRSQLQPFMNTLDCADPSLQVARRNESLTPLQALVMLNDGLIVTMSKHFAERLERSEGAFEDQVARGFRDALGRPPSEDELAPLVEYATRFGLANYCRLLLNLNEFSFVD